MAVNIYDPDLYVKAVPATELGAYGFKLATERKSRGGQGSDLAHAEHRDPPHPVLERKRKAR